MSFNLANTSSTRTRKKSQSSQRRNSLVTMSTLSLLLGKSPHTEVHACPRADRPVFTSSVGGVTPNSVIYTVKRRDETGKLVTEQHAIPTNFVLWSTGIAMNPFTKRVASLLPNQAHKKAIETDAYLRVLGAPNDEVYAIGDCANIETSLIAHFSELVDECDVDKNGKIDFGEWETMGTYRICFQRTMSC